MPTFCHACGPLGEIESVGTDPAVGITVLLARPRCEGWQLGHIDLPHSRPLMQAKVLGAAHVEGAVLAEAPIVLSQIA